MKPALPAAVAAFLLVMGPLAAAPAKAADTNSWSNPFCGAEVAAVSIGDGRYALEVFADGKTDVAGAVTLITDTDAYSVEIPKTDLLRQGGTDRFYIEPIVVAFDKPVTVKYAYIDSIGVDGAAPAACPTVVFPIAAAEGDEAHPLQFHISSDTKPVTAKFLQALPSLPCGKTYIEPGGPRDYSGSFLGSGYGNKQLTAEVRIFIDSNGIPLGATLFKSSGVEGFDNVAVGASQHTRYQPAKFLCTPVVSEIYYKIEYNP